MAAFVAATADPGGDGAVVCAPAGGRVRLEQRLFRLLLRRQLGEVEAGHAAPTRRCWFVYLHVQCPLAISFQLSASEAASAPAESIIFTSGFKLTADS